MTGFLPSRHGFPFPNAWPDGQPVLEIPSPFGCIPVGNAALGVCGGMVFAAIDLFTHGRPAPPAPTRPVFRYLARRLLDSWDLPFGGPRYYAWQVRPSASRYLGGERVLAGLSALTVEQEWPKVRAVLDAGHLVPLGLVQEDSWDVRRVGRNHQVLAYGYETDGTAVRLKVYDPNYPCDDGLSLAFDVSDPDAGRPITHSIEGPRVRGFFLTEYRKPGEVPPFR